MIRTVAWALLLALLPAMRPASAEDVTPDALVASWLAADVKARGPLGSRVRKLGPKAAPALRAAARDADAARRKRIEALLRRIQVDHHRAHTPTGMIYIPAGPLEVPRDGRPWGPSGTRRQVGAFYLDRTEVTVGAWRAWLAKLEATEEGSVRRLGLRRPGDGQDDDLPVTRVRHPDAVRFAEAHGGRLPTADEFERALRGSGASRPTPGARSHALRPRQRAATRGPVA